MKKQIIVIGAIACVAIGLLIVWTVYRPSGTVSAVEGKTLSIGADANSMLIKDGNGREIVLDLSKKPDFFDESLNKVDARYIRPGFLVRVEGRETGNTIIPENVHVVQSPNIIVFAPKAGTEVGVPLRVEGEARVFENQLNVRLKDADGTILTERGVTAQSPDIGLYGPFALELTYPEPEGTEGTIEAFDYSAKDGSEIDKVIIPVTFGEVPTMTVKVFWGNSKKESELFDCTAAYPVERRVLETDAPARAALEELLRGPDREESEDGYFSSINIGVGIQSLAIVDGTARVDFSKALEEQVGGSCRVAAIRSQIIETLKQFPTVKDVLISIDGRTEDILQP